LNIWKEGERDNKRTETVTELLKLKDFSLRELLLWTIDYCRLYT